MVHCEILVWNSGERRRSSLETWRRTTFRRSVAARRNVTSSFTTNLSLSAAWQFETVVSPTGTWQLPTLFFVNLTGNIRRNFAPRVMRSGRDGGGASGCISNDNNSFCIIHFVRARFRAGRVSEIGFTVTTRV